MAIRRIVLAKRATSSVQFKWKVDVFFMYPDVKSLRGELGKAQTFYPPWVSVSDARKHGVGHLVLHKRHGLAVDEQHDVSVFVSIFARRVAVVQRDDQPEVVPEHDGGDVGESAITSGDVVPLLTWMQGME